MYFASLSLFRLICSFHDRFLLILVFAQNIIPKNAALCQPFLRVCAHGEQQIQIRVPVYGINHARSHRAVKAYARLFVADGVDALAHELGVERDGDVLAVEHDLYALVDSSYGSIGTDVRRAVFDIEHDDAVFIRPREDACPIDARRERRAIDDDLAGKRLGYDIRAVDELAVVKAAGKNGIVHADEHHALLHVDDDFLSFARKHARDLVEGARGTDDGNILAHGDDVALAHRHAVTVEGGESHHSFFRLDEAAFEHGARIVLRAAERGARDQFFQIFLQKRELILADFHVDGGKIIRVQKLYDALRVRILDGQFVPVGGKGDLHVLQFLDKVGKILSGNGDVAFFENFRVDFFLYGDLARPVDTSVKPSFFAEILIHSRMGLVVLVLHALTTFITASERSSPSHITFIKTSVVETNSLSRTGRMILYFFYL